MQYLSHVNISGPIYNGKNASFDMFQDVKFRNLISGSQIGQQCSLRLGNDNFCDVSISLDPNESIFRRLNYI